MVAQYIGYMFYIPAVSFLYDLFSDIKYVTFTWTETKDISSKCLKFSIHVDEGHLEGTMSQISYLVPSFYLIKSRKLSFKKYKKFPEF